MRTLVREERSARRRSCARSQCRAHSITDAADAALFPPPCLAAHAAVANATATGWRTMMRW